jgi:hypothetical protein
LKDECHRPYTSPLTDFVRIELIETLQKRLGMTLKKDLTDPQRLLLEASMSHCEILDSTIHFQLEDTNGNSNDYSD